MSISYPGDPIQYIQNHPQMYLPGDERSLAEKLILLLVQDALSLNAKSISIARREDWNLVGATSDWLKLGRHQVQSPTELFYKIVALPEAGQNAIRHEVVVRAFSSRVLIFGRGEHQFLGPSESEDPEKLLLEECESMGKCRIVGFQISAN